MSSQINEIVDRLLQNSVYPCSLIQSSTNFFEDEGADCLSSLIAAVFMNNQLEFRLPFESHESMCESLGSFGMREIVGRVALV